MNAKPTVTPEIAMVHLSQDELDQIMRMHALYLKGHHGGARAVIKFRNLSGLSFRGQDLSHADFTGSCLIGTDMSAGKFVSSTFFACDMRRANLERASFVRADFRGAFVAGANLRGADLKSADLREGKIMEKSTEGYLADRVRRDGQNGAVARTVFTGARMMETNLSGVRAASADFSDADLSNVRIQGADFRNANLEGANLSHSDLSGTDLRGSSLKHAILEKTIMLMTETEGADFDNVMTEKATGEDVSSMDRPLIDLLDEHVAWVKSGGAKGRQLDLSGYDLRDIEDLRKCPLTAMRAIGTNFLNQDFSGAEVQSAVFDKSDFRDCVFLGTDVRGSSFTDARLSRCDFTGANLSPLIFYNEDGSIKRVQPVSMMGATLRYSIMRNAKMQGIRLRNADLSYADFSGADLRKADLTGARMDGAIFSGTLLDGATLDPDVELV